MCGITHVIIENTQTNEIFRWLLSLIGNNSLFIYILTVLVKKYLIIGTKWHDFWLFGADSQSESAGIKIMQSAELAPATWHSTPVLLL